MTTLKFIVPSNYKSLMEANSWGCNVKNSLAWNEGINKGRDITSVLVVVEFLIGQSSIFISPREVASYLSQSVQR